MENLVIATIRQWFIVFNQYLKYPVRKFKKRKLPTLLKIAKGYLRLWIDLATGKLFRLLEHVDRCCRPHEKKVTDIRQKKSFYGTRGYKMKKKSASERKTNKKGDYSKENCF